MTERTLDVTMGAENDRFTGYYTETQLRAAIDKVTNPNDWRGKIDAVVHLDEVHLVNEAVIFFTATKPTFETVEGDEVAIRVQSIGYRLGPAGDH